MNKPTGTSSRQLWNGSLHRLEQPLQQDPPPDPEVVEKPVRRKFSAKYKLRILREAEACAPGELASLLRREGLYFSNLRCWQRQRAQGELIALSPKQRGRKKKPIDANAKRVAELERENQRLQERLKQAEAIIEVQKKVAALLGNLAEKDENS